MENSSPIRKTTQYSFMVGYIMIATTLFLIIVGLFKGIITEHNITEIVGVLLTYATAMFGLNVGRVATENRASIKYGRIISDGTPPDPKLKEAVPQNSNTGKPITNEADPMAAFDIPVER